MTDTKKSRRIRPLRLVIVFVVALAAVCLAILSLVRLGTFDRLLLDAAAGRLAKSQGIALSAEKVVIDPFKLSVSLKNPVFHTDSGSSSLLRRFGTRALYLDVPFSTLVSGKWRIQRIRIVQPEVILDSVHGSRSVPEAQATPVSVQPSSGLDIRIGALDIEAGRVSWRSAPGRPFGLSLRGVEIRGRYDLSRMDHAVTLSAAGGEASLADVPVVLSGLRLRGRGNGRSIRVDSFELDTAASTVRLAGHLSNPFGEAEFEVEGNLSLSLPEFVRPPSPPLAVEGLAVIEASLSGRPHEFRYLGTVATRDLVLGDLGPGSFSASVRGDGNEVSLTSLGLETGAGIVRGRLSLPPTLTSITDVDLEWKDLDPDRILRMFGTGYPAIGSRISGKIIGRASSFAFPDIEAEASIDLVPRSGSLRSSAPPTSRANPDPVAGTDDSRLSPSGRIALKTGRGTAVLEKASLQVGGIDLEASGTVKPGGTLAGRFSMKAPDLREAGRRLSRFRDLLPRLTPATSHLESSAGSAEIEGIVSGSLERPALSLHLHGADLEYRGVGIETFLAVAETDLTALTVRELEAPVAGGRLSGSGVLALGPTAPGISPTRFDLDIDGIRLGAFDGFLPDHWKDKIGGTLSGHIKVTTAEAGPAVDFTASLADFAVSGLVLPSVRAAGRYRTSAVDITDFLLESEKGSVSGNGRFSPLSGSFEIAARSTGIGLEILDPFTGPDFPLEGTAAFDLDIEGDMKHPSGALDLRISGLRAGTITVGAAELKSDADGSGGRASLRLAELNTVVTAMTEFGQARLVRGTLKADGLPLDFLSGGPSGPEERRHGARLNFGADFRIPLGAPDEFSAEIIFSGKDIRLSGGGPAAPASHPPATVSFEGSARAEGNPFSMGTLRLGGKIPHLTLALGEDSYVNPEAIGISLDGGILHLDSMKLAGPQGTITVSGTAGPWPDVPRLDLRVSTDIDIATVAPLTPEMLWGGRLNADLAFKGELTNPSLEGLAKLDGVYVRFQAFPLTLSGIRGELDFRESKLSLRGFAGSANGTPFTAEGGLDGFGQDSPLSGKFTIRAASLPLNYPPGLRTNSEVRLVLEGTGQDWTAGGEVMLLRGLFREDIYPGGQVLGFAAYRWERADSELPPLLRDIRLDLAVKTAEPMALRNNLANMEVLADMRVTGTLGLPLLSGRLQNAGVGEIVFGERRFVLETARLDFLGQRIPDPSLEVVAHTQISHNLEPLDVRLRLIGSASDVRYSLTSSPPRSKEDLSLILLTGRSLDEVRGNAVNTLTTQTIEFFSSPVASPVTRTLERLLKAEDVTVEPLIIAAEEDPGARFTFRKRISEKAAVTYSADISSTQKQTWILDYRLSRRFTLRAFRKDDGGYGGSFNHSFSLGGAPAAGTVDEVRTVLSGIRLEGDATLSELEIRKALKPLREGGRFTYSALNDAVDRLLGMYKKKRYANAGVRPTVTPDPERNGASVLLTVTAGNPVSIRYLGDPVASRTKKTVWKNWTGLLPDEANLTEARDLILKRLHRKGYFDAGVDAERPAAEGTGVYEISVRKGRRYKIGTFTVDGNEALSSAKIRKAAAGYPLASYKGLWNLVYDPRAALDSIRNAYGELGYNGAEIGRPVVAGDAETRTVAIRLTVAEGPRSTVRTIAFQGNASLAEKDLREVLGLKEGKPYMARRLHEDRDALLAFYRSRGFQEADVEAAVVSAESEPGVALLFGIREGPVHRISGVKVTGRHRTGENLILKTARIKEGDPFSIESLARGQKRLYDLSIFKTANVYTPAGDAPGTGRPILINVREEPPVTVTYGARYSTEDKLEGHVELSLVNIFGGGLSVHSGFRESPGLRDARFSLKTPFLFGLRSDTIFSLHARRDVRESFTGEEIGGSVRQEIVFAKDFGLSLFYRLDRVREKLFGEAEFGPPAWLSELALNLVRDTRDDRLDPAMGSFLSFSLTYSPKFIGSELPYWKFYTQYSYYKNLGGGIVWASNLRLGLAHAYDRELALTRRFFAGGGTSIRGFRQDWVGPLNPETGLPDGGAAVVLVNQEIRVPLLLWFKGVVFWDIGNVYPTIRDMTRFSLRNGVGLGLRFESPVGLVRFDCGFNPFRRPGEPATVLFLSLGQAF